MVKKKKEEKSNFQPVEHVLVPKHRILSEEEKNQLLEKYNISTLKLPFILSSDVLVKQIKARVGDMIEISRKSKTAGETKYYRYVVN
jgi:DNA-directed RNA polymerase subunit H